MPKKKSSLGKLIKKQVLKSAPKKKEKKVIEQTNPGTEAASGITKRSKKIVYEY